MPVAAQESKKFEEETKILINKLLRCEKLSPFDSSRYSRYADDLMKNNPDGGLQIKGILALFSDNENEFNKYFNNAIRISKLPVVVRVNYIHILIIYGNYELAENLLKEILDSPGQAIEANMLCQCLNCCSNMDNFDLAERFIYLIKKSGVNLSGCADAVISHYGCFVSEKIPELMERYFDFIADDNIANDSQIVWKNIDNFAREIESEHV